MHLSRETDLDSLYDRVDKLMLAGEWDEINEAMAQMDARSLPTDILIGWLTVSSWNPHKVWMNVVLRGLVPAILKERGEYEEGLLDGLRPFWVTP